MGIPKKKKKLISEEKIAKAVEMASEQADTSEMTEIPETRSEKTGTQITEKGKKKIGRKPLAGNRPSKITFYVSEDTERRLNLALPHEQIRLARNNAKTDKSLIIETALKEWMDRNGY